MLARHKLHPLDALRFVLLFRFGPTCPHCGDASGSCDGRAEAIPGRGARSFMSIPARDRNFTPTIVAGDHHCGGELGVMLRVADRMKGETHSHSHIVHHFKQRDV